MPLSTEMSYLQEDGSPCNGTENVTIIVYKKKVHHHKKRKTNKFFACTQQKQFVQPSLRFIFKKKGSSLSKHYSMPELVDHQEAHKLKVRSSNTTVHKSECPFNHKYIVNFVPEYRISERLNSFHNAFPQAKWRVYRCQLSNADDSCCCACNSDAMFEVMKSLYDCYKKKDCDHCNCILCGHLPREERRLGELRKTGKMRAIAVGEEAVGKKKIKKEKAEKEKLKKAQAAGLITPLAGKTPQEKERIIRGLVQSGLPLPEAKSSSEKKLIDKVRTEMGLPPEPKTPSIKERYSKAQAAGIITPLEGKTPAQKERILKAQAEARLPLPEGRTASEKKLIEKVKAAAAKKEAKVPSAIMRQAETEGLLTPLKGKTPEEKERIIRGLVKKRIPLPEAKSASEKKIIDKVRADMGLPPEPKTPSIKERYAKAQAAGIITPLEGKTPAQKEKILKAQAEAGLPLPEGRTASEKKLIEKVKAAAAKKEAKVPSAIMRQAEAEGLLTPLKGKTPEEIERIIRGLVKKRIPLPEAKSASEKKIIDTVRADMGLPPEPETPSIKERYAKAQAAGIITPLEGKTPAQKEKILKAQADAGLPLPEGRTASEKKLIEKVKAAAAKKEAKVPSAIMRQAEAEGLLTPLKGKTPQEKERIIRGLVKKRIPLPEAKSASEKKIIDKVRAEMGLPPEPKTPSIKERYAKAQAAGIITPLEGKTAAQKEKVLKAQADAGLPLPEGRTASEKKLIEKVKAAAAKKEAKVPSEIMRQADAEGLLTPLKGKTPQEKERIIRGLVKKRIPLPEAKSVSEKKIIDKVRAEMGLPPEPKTPSIKERYAKAQAAGIITPLEGKTQAQKEKILKAQAEAGLPLPEGRTASEKKLIEKVKAAVAKKEAQVPSAIMRQAEAEGFLTPLKGKTPQEKERIIRGLVKKRIPLPEAKSVSEKKIIDKVRAEMGLPPEPKTPSLKERYAKAQAAGIITPLEGKTPAQKEKILKAQAEAGIPLPEGRTASEKKLIEKVKTAAAKKEAKVPSEIMRQAEAEGLLTPLKGKTPREKERIIRGLVQKRIPLPEAKSASEKKIIDKVRAEMGLPPEPKTPSIKERYAKAQAAGIITPLEGKTPAQKEKILKAQAEAGLPLPEGRTASEKKIIEKIKSAAAKKEAKVPSAIMRQAEAEGLLTPLIGKTPQEKERIIRGLVQKRIPIPEAKSASEKKIIDKVRAEMGLPPEPKTPSIKERYARAQAAGIITPLEDKTPAQKEKILKAQAKAGLPLPEGRTASEKKLIEKVKAAAAKKVAKVTSEKLRQAKAEGLLTPLKGKSPQEKEKIIRGLAQMGIPLPEAKSASEKKIIDKVRAGLGLPPEPKTPSIKEKYAKAQAAGIITPLEGKTPAQKEQILKAQVKAGIPLPEGRTASEKNIINKVRAEMGLPPEPRTLSIKEKYAKAQAAGIITPLEGKTPAQKEKILKAQTEAGIPLPEGRTASEKEILKKILEQKKKTKAEEEEEKFKTKAVGIAGPGQPALPPEKAAKLDRETVKGMQEAKGRSSDECICGLLTPEAKRAPLVTPSVKGRVPSKVYAEKLKAAKAAGLLTPLKGKTPKEKEKIIRGLAQKGLPLPAATTASERKLIDKVRADMGLPPEPKTPSIKEKYEKAQAAGIITPLEGKTPAQKEKILRALAEAGIPLPEGRTPSEKAIISKIKTAPVPSAEKLRKAKAAGLLTPLKGKTSQEKERIIRGLAQQRIPLPEAKTASEKNIIDKVRAEMGLPPEPKTPSLKEKYAKAQAAGIITPLEGKTAAQKEKILKAQAKAGLALPEGRTTSEKNLIDKIRAELGLPPEPKTPSMKEKYAKAQAAGIITPLEGKTSAQKEKILKSQTEAGIPLPDGRTPSEKAMINKIKAAPVPSAEKLRKAKAAGLLTPLKGKTPQEKEIIIRSLAQQRIPLPEAKSASEKKIIDKVRAEMGLPPEPKTPSLKERYAKAQAAGIITPLEGKTPAQKEKILKAQVKAGIPLPEGRTASEKNIIDKVRAEMGLPPQPKTPSIKERYAKAQAAGIITPLEGKTPAQKEKILKAQADAGLHLPEGRTASEKKLIEKVKATAAKKEAKVPSEIMRQAEAEGLLTPLKGKTQKEREIIIRGLAQKGIPLPEAKSASEKIILDKVRAEMGLPPEPKTPSIKEKYAKAQAAGIITPLEGKTPAQKEQILKAQVKAGIPLPEGRTASEKNIINKVRNELGLPPEPKTPSIKKRYEKAQAAGIITPLQGKTSAQKEKILISQAEAGIPLPEGRTTSENKLIEKVKAAAAKKEAKVPSAIMRQAEAEGLLTPLKGKTPQEKERIIRGLVKKRIPLPEAKSASEKKIIDKVRAEMGLPPEPKTPSIKERYAKAQAAGIITPLEGKTSAQKEKILKAQADAGLPLPEGRTASEKKLIEKVKAAAAKKEAKVPSAIMRQAETEGLLTPLKGKTPQEKERIIRGLVQKRIPLPEAKSTSEKKIIDKVRAEMGLPPEPKTPSIKERYAKGQAAGIITPLEGKTAAQKEKILKAQADAGLLLPEGRTASEKKLIEKVKAAASKKEAKVPSAIMRQAEAEGLLTPLKGKTPQEKERIIRGLVQKRIPLPEAKSTSEKNIIDKVRAEMGLPPEPKTPSIKERYAKAQAAGIITPLEGKTAAQKEKILKAQADAGLPLPEGRTASEKKLIEKVKAAAAKKEAKVPSAIMRQAQAEGLLTPLKGKTPQEKERIIRGLVKKRIPLPEAKSASEKNIIDKVRAEMGLPPEPKTPSIKERYAKAQAAGIITPLEGKTAAQKEKILKAQADAGLPLPEGRTASEKKLIEKVKAAAAKKEAKVPSEIMRQADAEGLLTPLKGKTPQEKERIIRGLVQKRIPLPEAKSASEKKIIDKVRAEMGLPPEPKTPYFKEKYAKAQAAGIITPLEGKTPAQKEKILKAQVKAGIPLPEGRTASEEKLIDKVRAEMGLPPTPKTPSIKEKYAKAQASGIITPLEGKTPAQKEKILKALAAAGIPLPEGRTPSEKAIISKIKAAPPTPSEKLRKAKADGLLTPLDGKTALQKEKIIRDLAAQSLPLPEAKTASEKNLVAKVRKELGLPPEPKTAAEKAKYDKALAAGVIVPLEGKTLAEKEKILQAQADMGIALPEGQTPSEKSLIKKILAAPVKKTKSKKVEAVSVKAAARDVGVVTKTKDGIEEKYEDIIKTTTCEKGCGCDKKKIRFKHSYVKIRVTSPDISSLCPCPNECVPGVKGGVFTDNEGIKVTVGSAVGVPSLFMEKVNGSNYRNDTFINDIYTFTNSSHSTIPTDEKKTLSENYLKNDNIEFILKKNSFYTDSEQSLSTCGTLNHSKDNSILYDLMLNNFEKKSEFSDKSSASRYLVTCSESYTPPLSVSWNSSNELMSSKSSLMSMCKTESSLSFSSACCASIGTISIISVHQSSIMSTSSHYLCYSQSTKDVSVDESEFFTHDIGYRAVDSESEYSESGHHISNDELKVPTTQPSTRKDVRDFFVFRLSQPNLTNTELKGNTKHEHKPTVVINYLNSDHDINKILDEVIAKEQFPNDSSLFVILPTSDENGSLSETTSSTICIRLSENYFRNDFAEGKKNWRPEGFKFVTKGKRNRNNQPKPFNYQNRYREIDKKGRHRASKNSQPRRNKIMTENKANQIDNKEAVMTHRVIGTYTSQNRLSYCPLKKPLSHDERNTSNQAQKLEGREVSFDLKKHKTAGQTAELDHCKYVDVKMVGMKEPIPKLFLPANISTQISPRHVSGAENPACPADEQCSCQLITPSVGTCQFKKEKTKNTLKEKKSKGKDKGKSQDIKPATPMLECPPSAPCSLSANGLKVGIAPSHGGDPAPSTLTTFPCKCNMPNNQNNTGSPRFCPSLGPPIDHGWPGKETKPETPKDRNETVKCKCSDKEGKRGCDCKKTSSEPICPIRQSSKGTTLRILPSHDKTEGLDGAGHGSPHRETELVSKTRLCPCPLGPVCNRPAGGTAGKQKPPCQCHDKKTLVKCLSPEKRQHEQSKVETKKESLVKQPGAACTRAKHKCPSGCRCSQFDNRRKVGIAPSHGCSTGLTSCDALPPVPACAGLCDSRIPPKPPLPISACVGPCGSRPVSFAKSGPASTGPKPVNDFACQYNRKGKGKKEKCTCTRRPKNVMCECPEPVVEPVIPDEDSAMMDYNNRRIKSNLTQTTSGFKFKIKEKQPAKEEEEISFEGALMYLNLYDTYSRNLRKGIKRKRTACECAPPKANECACPPNLNPEEEPKEPLKGFKVTVDGKGSGSIGLAAVPCFDKCFKGTKHGK